MKIIIPTLQAALHGMARREQGRMLEVQATQYGTSAKKSTVSAAGKKRVETREIFC